MKHRLSDFKYINKNDAESLGVSTEDEILNICKNGRLIYSRWYYDELTSVGKYIFLDVTDKFSNYLFDRVRFVDGLLLKDILLLVQNNISFIDPILGNYCKEITNAGLTDIKPYTNEYDPDGIEYLEFYRYLNVEKDYREPPSEHRTVEFVSGFHSIGFELQEDYNYHSKGTRINWSLGCIKINEIADTPIKINPYAPFYDIDTLSDGPTEIFSSYEPKMIDILNEIFFELSRYGPPDNKDEP